MNCHVLGFVFRFKVYFYPIVFAMFFLVTSLGSFTSPVFVFTSSPITSPQYLVSRFPQFRTFTSIDVSVIQVLSGQVLSLVFQPRFLFSIKKIKFSFEFCIWVLPPPRHAQPHSPGSDINSYFTNPKGPKGPARMAPHSTITIISAKFFHL